MSEYATAKEIELGIRLIESVAKERIASLESKLADANKTIKALTDPAVEEGQTLQEKLAIAVRALEIAKADILHFKETSKMRLYPTLETIDTALVELKK